MSESQTLVVKLGTSVLTGGSRRLNRAHIVELVRQCAQLHAMGHRIVIVTSGAIAAGRGRRYHSCVNENGRCKNRQLIPLAIDASPAKF
nr:hypothetical protein [Klebsiella pneumoniae]